MEEAAQLCDRVVIMDSGKILVEGAPETLVRLHAGKEVLEIVPEKYDEVITTFLKQIPDIDILSDTVNGRVYIYCDDCQRVYNDLRKKFDIVERVIRMANLEDVFLKLTGRGLRE
jgi:lipooligosaccharide transport system ATP-binding protein